MSPGDSLYPLVSLLMQLGIAVVGGLPIWLALRASTSKWSWAFVAAWLAGPVALVLAGLGDPHDFIRFFVLPPFLLGAVIAALFGAWAAHSKGTTKTL